MLASALSSLSFALSGYRVRFLSPDQQDLLLAEIARQSATDGTACRQAHLDTLRLLDLPLPALELVLRHLDPTSAANLGTTCKRVHEVFGGCRDQLATRCLQQVYDQVSISAEFKSNICEAQPWPELEGPVRISLAFEFNGGLWNKYIQLLGSGLLHTEQVGALFKLGATAVAGLTKSQKPFLPGSQLIWSDCLSTQHELWSSVGVEGTFRLPPECSAWFYGNFDTQTELLSTEFERLPKYLFQRHLKEAGACLPSQCQIRRLCVSCHGGTTDVASLAAG